MIRKALRKIVHRGRQILVGPGNRVVPDFPHYICMEVTNACNLRCVQCLYKGGSTGHYRGKVGFIDVDFAIRILDQLGPHGCGVMLNGDGEALLHPRFQEIARHAVELGLPDIYFNTNGTRFTREFTDRFVTYFRGAVSFSLDGFKESHERIRVGSSYDQVMANIGYLQEKIREHCAPIKLSVAYCNYDQPAGEKESFVRFWVDRVDSITVGEVYDKEYRIVSDQINRSDVPNRVQCGIPWETMIVRWDGTVIPCSNFFSLDGDPDLLLGDANCSTLHQIWHGDAVAALRDRTERWQLKNTVCERCERWNMYVQFGEREEDGMLVNRSGAFTHYRRKGA